MKKLLLGFLFALLTFSKGNAQFYSGGGSYLPKPCTTNDSIIIYDTLTVRASIIMTRQANVTFSNDTIYINESFDNDCVSIEDAEIYRTTNIGKLNKGIYNVEIYASYRNFSCNQADTFLNRISFKIFVFDKPNSIDDTYSATYPTYSSIFRDLLEVKDVSLGSRISVFDIQNRCLHSSVTTNESLNLRTSDWPNGVYIIAIESNGKQKRYKVAKE